MVSMVSLPLWCHQTLENHRSKQRFLSLGTSSKHFWVMFQQSMAMIARGFTVSQPPEMKHALRIGSWSFLKFLCVFSMFGILAELAIG